MDTDRPAGVVVGAEDGDVTETDEEFTNANRVNDHRGPRIWLA